MLRHYYTLIKVVEELDRLVGSRLVETFSQEKNSFDLIFLRAGVDSCLHISTDPTAGSIYLRSRFSRAKKNTAEIFPEIYGCLLASIALADADRIIILDFGRLRLEVLMYGGSKSNAFLLDSNNIIIGSFKNKKKYVGTTLDLKASPTRQPQCFEPDMPLIGYLARIEGLGKYYAAELCHRLGVDPSIKCGDLPADELTSYTGKAAMMKQECHSSSCFNIARNHSDEYILSLVQLKDYPIVEHTTASISEAIRKRIDLQRRQVTVIPVVKNLQVNLARLEDKIVKKIESSSIVDDIESRIKKYKDWADLLASQPNPRSRQGKAISLFDWNGSETEIPLDPQLTLIENADRYYTKARSAREDLAHRQLRLPTLRRKLESVRLALKQLESVDSQKSLNQFISILKTDLKIKMTAPNTGKPGKPDPADRFRCFDLGEGYTLYVGKNSANNDELTLRFAKPNDIWLHARGAGGSHAVLPLESSGKPPKEILRRSAEIAAYYSQARNAKYVHVSYTQKKYVRKPKGAPPGSVVIAREEVIMVEPKLPDTEAM